MLSQIQTKGSNKQTQRKCCLNFKQKSSKFQINYTQYQTKNKKRRQDFKMNI